MMSSFTHHYAIPNLYEFLSSEDIWSMLITEQLLQPLTCIVFSIAMEVNGYQQLFGTNWQYINDEQNLNFWVKYPFKVHVSKAVHVLLATGICLKTDL